MNRDYVQGIRYKLQKRARRLNSTNYPFFHSGLRLFWRFLHDTPLLAGVLQGLARQDASIEASAQEAIQGKPLIFDEEEAHAAFAYFILKACAETDNQDIEQSVEYVYTHKLENSLEHYKSAFLEPIYEYLDEHLDDQRATLALLRRYKHKCEWFQRDFLYQLWESDTRRGEKRLAMHLYEYLHDQGLDFAIEPRSASGEADLVMAQQTSDPLIADAKIFAPERGKAKDYICASFNQVYTYTLDFNEPFGYLIIFKASPDDLKIELAQSEQGTPFLAHNNKTIFFLVVDIFPHETSASKRGTLRAVEVRADDFVKVIEATRMTRPEAPSP